MILLLLLSREEEEYEEEEEQTYASSRPLGTENKEREKTKALLDACVCVFVREYLLRFVWWFDVTVSAFLT